MPLRLPCSPADVSLLPEFSRQPATAAPCRGCRSYFSFSCYGSLFHLYQTPATRSFTGKYFSAKPSPSSPIWVFRVFCILKGVSPAICQNLHRQITTRRNTTILIFTFQGSPRLTVISLSGNILQILKMFPDRPTTVCIHLWHYSYVLHHKLNEFRQK